MFEIVLYPLPTIVFVYVAVAGACLVTYPVIKLLSNAMMKGASKWK